MDSFWNLLPALIGSALAGGVLTYIIGLQQLSLQRRMDATQSFLQICAHAHGRPHGDRDSHVGLAEQLAAMEMVLGLANKYRFLREPARAALMAMEVTYGNRSGASKVISEAASLAHSRIKGRSSGMTYSQLLTLESSGGTRPLT